MTRALGVGLGFAVILAMVSCGSDDGAKTAPSGAQGGDANAGEPAAFSGSSGSSGSTSGGTHDVGGQSSAAGKQNTGGSEPTAGAPAAGAGGASPEGCTLAQTWEVVDDYAEKDGTQTNVASIAADPQGNVYAVGLGNATQGALVGTVRRSANAGKTWENAGWKLADGLPNDVAVDDSGNVFVAAGLTTGSIFKSVDKGASFQKVFDIPTTPAQSPCNTGFVATGSNGVVVAGGSCDDAGWTIHKSIDGGKTWALAFAFQLVVGKASRLQDVGVGPDDNVYASGSGVDANDKVHWLVVRKGAAGAVVSDNFQLAAGMPARAFGFATHGAPTVTGSAADATGTHGVVRRMTAPDEWETLDTFLTRGADVEAVGQQLVVIGQLENPAVHAIARQSADDGKTWSASEQYEYAAAQPAFVSALTADGFGNVYSVVSARDENTVARWVVRKLSCE